MDQPLKTERLLFVFTSPLDLLLTLVAVVPGVEMKKS